MWWSTWVQRSDRGKHEGFVFSIHCGFWALKLCFQVCVTSAFTFWAISIVLSVKLAWNLVTVYIHSDLEHTGDKCIHSHVSRRKSPSSLGCWLCAAGTQMQLYHLYIWQQGNSQARQLVFLDSLFLE